MQKEPTLNHRGRATINALTLKPVKDPEVWRQALRTSSYAHALQSWAWGEFKGRWGWTPQPHVALNAAGETVAAAQLLKRHLPGLPFSIAYVPKGPCLDYADVTLRRQVLTALINLARQEGAIFLKIDPDTQALEDVGLQLRPQAQPQKG